MSARTHAAERRLFADLSVGQVLATVLAALLVSAVGGALSVWVTQARATDRLSAVEAQVERNKAEREQQVKELREHTITRGEFDAFRLMLKETRDDVREIRSAVMGERRGDRR